MPAFESFGVTYTTQGVGASALRFVVPLSNFKFELSENALKGYGIKIVMKDKATGEEKTYNGIIDKNEMRETANRWHQSVILAKASFLCKNSMVSRIDECCTSKIRLPRL